MGGGVGTRAILDGSRNLAFPHPQGFDPWTVWPVEKYFADYTISTQNSEVVPFWGSFIEIIYLSPQIMNYTYTSDSKCIKVY
jgi:hypothetical protein